MKVIVKFEGHMNLDKDQIEFMNTATDGTKKEKMQEYLSQLRWDIQNYLELRIDSISVQTQATERAVDAE